MRDVDTVHTEKHNLLGKELQPSPIKTKHVKTPSEIEDEKELRELVVENTKSIRIAMPVTGLSNEDRNDPSEMRNIMNSIKNKLFCVKCKQVVEQNHSC